MCACVCVYVYLTDIQFMLVWRCSSPLVWINQVNLHLTRLVGDRVPVQSRTGGVLGAVPSATVMGARRFFSRGEGKFRDAKKLTTFLVVALKTQVHCNYLCTKHFTTFPGGQMPSKTFFRRGPVFRYGSCVGGR